MCICTMDRYLEVNLIHVPNTTLQYCKDNGQMTTNTGTYPALFRILGEPRHEEVALDRGHIFALFQHHVTLDYRASDICTVDTDMRSKQREI